MVRTQVHAEDEEPMLEFEESGSATPIDIEEEEENGLDDDFFNIEDRNGVEDESARGGAQGGSRQGFASQALRHCPRVGPSCPPVEQF